MTATELLHRLADLAGIQSGFHDIWGKYHETTDEARVALLEALELPSRDEAAMAWAVRDLENRDWLQVLPPVTVAPAGQPAVVPLHLPEPALRVRHQWRLELETGKVLAGEVLPADLRRLGSREVEGVAHHALVLELPALADTGYHQLQLAGAADGWGHVAHMPLIIHPMHCHQPEAVGDGGRVWGVSAQLYGVRSSRNWGMGDFTDLRHLVEWCAQAGAGLLGVNPLHALFPHNPAHASPYSPSSRQFLNALYIDVEAVADFAECDAVREAVAAPDFQAELRAQRGAPLIDYPAVARLKQQIMRQLHAHFRTHHLDTGSPRGKDFRVWQTEGGDDLRRFALYQALQAHFHARDANLWGWPVWPETYRDHDSAEVAAFAAAHGDEVEYYQYLQWQAERQLAAVGQRSLELGLGLGLYGDLAVGVDKGGAETWMHRDLYALDTRIGCPPDDFNHLGQDWGLPPWIPQRLREAAYTPYIRMLRANMKLAGALRVDHVMGLMRLFWVPPGKDARAGAYLSYPLADLLGILALESERNRCLVIGEDLGTVPDEVRQALAELGVLSYKLFYFERGEDGGFRLPGQFPQQSLVAASTHDLPTLAGFWLGADLDLRTRLNLYADEEQRACQIVARADDRARLLLALEREGLLPEGTGVHPVSVPEMTPALARAVLRYLARSPARVCLVQAEDMLGEIEQANLPGTVDQHPNWRRKLSLNLEEWPGDARIQALAEAMRAERGSGVRPPAPAAAGGSGGIAPRPVVAPRATYRIQFNAGFTFPMATALVPYLAELGVSHVYCSPCLKARSGSPHGYDIIDHGGLNPEIGSEDDLAAFRAALAGHGMGQILDVVPNHMGIMGIDNGWWLDVLENGQASAYAEYFDIDWQPVKPSLLGKVLVPVLGDHYGAVLERGELKLAYDAEQGEFSLWYWEHRFPIDPREYPRILLARLDSLTLSLGAEHPICQEFQSLTTAFSHLPARDGAGPEHLAERQRDKVIHKRHLADLVNRSPDLQRLLHETLETLNGRPGEPASYDALHQLIAAQAYRLAFWRVASDEINYRRFFDINDLAALRMEREEVFQAAHRYIGQLLQRGWLDGLRIDHADGLFAPAAYFRRLQQLHADARPNAATGLYVVVEKILAFHENLPADWAVAGTTGYDAGNLVNGLFVDGDNANHLIRGYEQFLGARQTFEEIVYDGKRLIMKAALSSELNVLANRLSRIAELDRHTRDYTLNSLRTALMEITAAFPVYRTYLCDGRISEEDRRHIEWACSVARKRAGGDNPGVYDFVRDVLLGDIAEGRSEAYRQVVLDFGMRYQQFSSPVMAKGTEDTAFYRYLPLASLNEVGGEPNHFGVSVSGFHHACLDRARRTPHGLLAGTTHDTKRGEDMRARLDVLSEIPDEWRQQLSRWHRLNRARFGLVEDMVAPGRRDEYLFYQTLLGTWPDTPAGEPCPDGYLERIAGYMLKAVREAKEWSTWTNPNAEYEGQLQNFVGEVLAGDGGRRFRQEIAPLAARLAHFGYLNSLAMTLLRLTMPGVPDLYQGNELWDFSLVDPDNRRPVDYERRRASLDGLRRAADEGEGGLPALCADLLASAADGRVKQYVVWRTLALRRQYPELFSQGDYLPIVVEGTQGQHLCAYARRHGAQCVLAVVPRLTHTLLDGKTVWPLGRPVWGDTRLLLPEGLPARWRDAFSAARPDVRGGRLEAAEVMGDFPVALLMAEDG
ncbi:MAG TPA: malto-oligosyltrehalose synthase [Thiobacillaceae bacterium]|nr:malto-oligosyltrehalose synthase [Thiobacillaceae bacterium]